MNVKEMIRKTVSLYFMLVTFITAGMMILGGIFEPDAELTYKAFASPLLFALLGVIPYAVMYSSKVLTVKQVLIREAVQLLVIEVEIVTVCVLSPSIDTDSSGLLAGVIISVFLIFVLSGAAMYVSNYLSAVRLTKELMDLKKKAG